MLIKAIKTFLYAEDGIHNVEIHAGETADVLDSIIPALISDGIIVADDLQARM